MFKKTLFAVLAGLMLTAGSAVASEGKTVVSVVSETSHGVSHTGLEVAFPCLFLDGVRQQLTLFSSHGVTTFVIAPHYLFEVAEHFEIGVGPAIIITSGSAAGTTTDGGLGVSLEYGIDDIRLGAQVDTVAGSTLSTLKLGYAF